MLKQRILTALVLAPAALLAVFALPLAGFMFVFDAVILIAAWEWANLSGYKTQRSKMLYVAVMALFVGLAHFSFFSMPIQPLLFISALSWLCALYWVMRYPQPGKWTETGSRALIGFVVLLPCWFAFVALKAHENGELLILLLFLLVWGADVGAYFAGKTFGKNKLAPAVSPGKTREGLYGGLLTCFLVALAYAWLNEYAATQLLLLLILAMLTGLISVLGDLFESMLKRHRGIKDSSQLLPGHGGVLDRIDSLTAASPLFVLGMHYLTLA